MTDARRGELWLIDLGEPVGHGQGWLRPAWIVTSDGWNRHAGVVTVLPVTGTRHGLPTRVEIEPDKRHGLDAVSYARWEDIRSVSEHRLKHRLRAVDGMTLAAVNRDIRLFLEV